MGADIAHSEVPRDHLMGYDGSILADGSRIVSMVFAMEVNMNGVDKDGGAVKMLDNWTTIACEASEKGDSANSGLSRLNGVWLRSALYVGSGPEFPSRLYASTTKSGLTGSRGIPAVPVSERKAPEFRRPEAGVRWSFSCSTGKWTPELDSDTEGNLPPSAIG